MDLTWNLDFTRKKISGSVEYEVVVETPQENILVVIKKLEIKRDGTNL